MTNWLDNDKSVEYFMWESVNFLVIEVSEIFCDKCHYGNLLVQGETKLNPTYFLNIIA